jgi:hypothetical protein
MNLRQALLSVFLDYAESRGLRLLSAYAGEDAPFHVSFAGELGAVDIREIRIGSMCRPQLSKEKYSAAVPVANETLWNGAHGHTSLLRGITDGGPVTIVIAPWDPQFGVAIPIHF